MAIYEGRRWLYCAQATLYYAVFLPQHILQMQQYARPMVLVLESLLLFKNVYLFNFWLCWVFIAVQTFL